QRDPAASRTSPPSHHRADRQSNEGRPRKMPRSRCLGLSGQARQHRAIAVGASDVAAPLMPLDLSPDNQVNILLVDDQPANLMSYEVVLNELGENLLKASSASEAFQLLLKNEIAVILIDVCMPELDGFELARMIREHPRFQQTAMIFISAIHLSELDSLKGYE